MRRHRKHIGSTHPRRKQRLMGIAHRGVCQQYALLRLHPLCKLLRTQREQALTTAHRNRRSQIDLRQQRRQQRQARQRAAFHLRMAVDHHIADKLKQPSRSIPTLRDHKQLGRGVNKAGRTLTTFEQRMRNHVFQKRQVRRHSTHAKLTQRARHALDGLFRIAPLAGHFHQQ